MRQETTVRASRDPIRFELHPKVAKINRKTGLPMKQEEVPVYQAFRLAS